MKKVIPFSNATDAATWLYHNCEQCRRSGCTKKAAINFGWVSGHVTHNVADYVGDFRNQCNNFSTVRIKPDTKPKKELTPKLF